MRNGGSSLQSARTTEGPTVGNGEGGAPRCTSRYLPAMISYPWRFTDTMRNKSLDRSACPAKYSVCLSLSIALTYICALEPRSSAQPRTVMGANEYPTLQSFRLDQTGEHLFRFRQTHSREMTLLLEIQGSTHEP